MTNINEAKAKELEELSKNKETLTLESLLLEGADFQVPITFNYPTQKGIVKVSAIIRPLTSEEWETATNYAVKHKKDFALKILEKGLLNDDGEPLPIELLRKMPVGVVNELYMRIGDISGVKQDKEEQYELTRQLMGF